MNTSQILCFETYLDKLNKIIDLLKNHVNYCFISLRLKLDFKLIKKIHTHFCIIQKFHDCHYLDALFISTVNVLSFQSCMFKKISFNTI